MKKVFVLMLLLLLPCFLLSCSENQPADTPADTMPELSMEERLYLQDAKAATFQVIRSDTLTGNDFETKGAIRVVSELTTLLGEEPALFTDYTGRGGYEEISCEILVGNTTRPESSEAISIMGESDYAICVLNTKVCIVAKHVRALEVAIDRFFGEVLYHENGELYLSKTLSIVDNYQLPEGAYFDVVGGTGSGATKFDTAVALACLQGIMNRESEHKVYVNSGSETKDWQEVLSSDGRWLESKTFIELSGYDELWLFAKDYVKAVVVWDESVPATLNVACTVAGVEDGVVMSETMYKKYKDRVADKQLISLVDRFDGSVTGSAKNDAYRWAIEEYLLTGRCSTRYICSYIDGWSMRSKGNISYAVVRDWGIYQRAFVYDLSPWGDEAPLDDPDQKLGTDKKTLLMIFDAMLTLTRDQGPYEVCGFFEHQKYSQAGMNSTTKYSSVRTEWEYAALMTPYNGYHNTCIDAAWNESFHTLYQGAQQLESNRPTEGYELEPGTVYLCFFMGDYDSTHPVYRYLKQAWDDPRRGEIPFAWAINPNLLETYPDIIEYYYETATENDYFVSDASAAGYFMPSYVPDDLWPGFLEHNIRYFERADMTIAPMVLDNRSLSPSDLDMMIQIAPDGLATVRQGDTYLYDDVVVTALLGGGYDRTDPVVGAQNLEKVVAEQFNRSKSGASLNLLRCVWTTPTVICEIVELYQEAHPDQNVVVVDIYNYFELMREDISFR